MFKHFVGTLVFVLCAAAVHGETPAGVPKGAEEVQPGVYRFVDKDKKAWIYRKTPFGMQKYADAAEAPVADAAGSEKTQERNEPAQPDRTKTPFGESKPSEAGRATTKVTESGDSIIFERQSPFGVYRWTRKKSDLTASERQLWEAQRSPAQADKK